VLRQDEITGGAQPRKRIVGYRPEDGYGPTAIGDLYDLAILNSPQQLTCPLAKLSHAHARHVLVVAHTMVPVAETPASRGSAGVRDPLACAYADYRR